MKNVVNALQVSRFIAAYDQAADQKGIKISVGFDFEEYVSITSVLPTKGRTYPNFRPDRSPIVPGYGYWIIGVNKDDDVVLTEAARLYDLSESSFSHHLESLKAFYGDPAIHAHPRDRCVCKAPSAKEITGRVAYHGDRWVREDFRGQGIAKIIAGTARGVSLSMWSPDFVCGLVARRLLEKGSVYGYAHHEPGGSILQLVNENIVDDDWLTWLTGDELRRLVSGAGSL
ncbi:hypothetical protein [Bradyrhizobium nanningense]|uniref:hypothetical protein n=1 Tax=Bradyrhizobium nanningense TaxID=1325118 RepID=UPI001008DC05|nr:hypothetical protein [Bradyrhizobium nanningense]